MEKVKKLVSENRLFEALDLLTNKYKSDKKITNDLVILLGRLTDLSREKALGIKSYEHLVSENVRLMESILYYADKEVDITSYTKINLPENFVGLGNEPGWSLRIEGNLIVFVSNYGTLVHAYSINNVFEKDTIWHYRSHSPLSMEKLFISVTITKEICEDDMSGEEYPYRVEITENFKHFIGVGKVIGE